MSKPKLTRLKNGAAPFAIAFALAVAVISFLVGVAELPISYGEVLTVMGVWLLFGTLLGQGKPTRMSVGRYLNDRPIAIGGIAIMFFLTALVYMVSADLVGAEVGIGEMFGLGVLASSGLLMGFIIGADKGRPKRRRGGASRPTALK